MDVVPLSKCARNCTLPYTTFVIVEVPTGSIRGAGQTVWPMLITLVGTCILRIAWMMLVVPHHWDITWVATVYPLSWVVTGIAFLVYWRFGSWRKALYAPDSGREAGAA